MECSVSKCSRDAVAKGYCGPHYMRVRTHGDPLAHVPIKKRRSKADMPKGVCGLCSEERLMASNGLCSRCLAIMMSPPELLERALERLRVEEDEDLM